MCVLCVWCGVGGLKRCGNRLYNIQLARTVKTKGEKICSSPFFYHLSSSDRTEKQNFVILTKIAFFYPPPEWVPLGLTASVIISQLVARGDSVTATTSFQEATKRDYLCVWSPPTTVLPCPPTHGKIATANKPTGRSTTKEKCCSSADASCLLLGANYKK